MISCYMNLCDHPKNFARRTIILDSNYNPYIYIYIFNVQYIYIYLYNNLMSFFFAQMMVFTVYQVAMADGQVL